VSLYQSINFGVYSASALFYYLFLLGSSSRVRDFLPYLYVLVWGGVLPIRPPGRAGWLLSTSVLSPILSPLFIPIPISPWWLTPSTASQSSMRDDVVLLPSFMVSLVLSFLPYRLYCFRVSWYRSFRAFSRIGSVVRWELFSIYLFIGSSQCLSLICDLFLRFQFLSRHCPMIQ